MFVPNQSVTQYKRTPSDMLCGYGQLAEDGWRLNQIIQEERGARQWDISMRQSKINEFFGLIHDLTGTNSCLGNGNK